MESPIVFSNKMMAYFDIICPHLSYGVTLWGGEWGSNQNVIRVFRLQKCVVKIVVKLQKRILQGHTQKFASVDITSLPLHSRVSKILDVKDKFSKAVEIYIHRYEVKLQGWLPKCTA